VPGKGAAPTPTACNYNDDGGGNDQCNACTRRHQQHGLRWSLVSSGRWGGGGGDGGDVGSGGVLTGDGGLGGVEGDDGGAGGAVGGRGGGDGGGVWVP
jgi:hypothetical protein